MHIRCLRKIQACCSGSDGGTDAGSMIEPTVDVSLNDELQVARAQVAIAELDALSKLTEKVLLALVNYQILMQSTIICDKMVLFFIAYFPWKLHGLEEASVIQGTTGSRELPFRMGRGKVAFCSDECSERQGPAHTARLHSPTPCMLAVSLELYNQGSRSSARDKGLGPGTAWLPGAMAWPLQRWLGGQCCGGVHHGGRHSVRRVARAGNCGLPSDLACWSTIWAIALTYIVHVPLRNWHFILEI